MAYASYPAAPPVAADDVMGGAEEYLDTIADDVPLFTNTREGVYSQDAGGPAPPPLEAASHLAEGLSDMRAMLMQRRANSMSAVADPKTSNQAANYDENVSPDASMAKLSVSERAKSFNSHATPPASKQSPGGGGGLEAEQSSIGIISGLQEIDGLQDDELDTSSLQPPVEEEEQTASVRARAGMFENTTNDNNNNNNGSYKSPTPASAISKPAIPAVPAAPRVPKSSPPQKLQDRTDEEAEALKGLQAQDRRDVSPSVIKGLVKIMGSGSPDKKRKATIAMCNLCCESTSNRACAHSAGIVAVLVGMMREENEDEHLRRLAVACICNLSADPPLKDSIAGSGAIPFLSRLLRQTDQGIDAQAATAHAAATLWSLCVDMEHIKPLIALDETLGALLALLKSPESFVRGQACGCVGEVCIGNKDIKGRLTGMGAIPSLIALLDENEAATQRLAASALCNLLANHDENKRLARDKGLLDAFAKLLKSTSDDAVLSAAAGGLYNLVSAPDRDKLESLGVVDILRKVPISKHIDVRLGIKGKK